MDDLLTFFEQHGEGLGRDDQYTWSATLDGERVVAKVMPSLKEERPSLPRVSCTPPWLRFHLLSLSEVTRLELDTSSAWILAVRPEIEGVTLEEADCDPEAAAVHLVRGLRDLHESGIVHGDIQPRNVIVDGQGKFWFIDVQLMPLTPQDTGYVAGSAPLMAPELWAGEASSEASDRYALATLLAWFGGGYPLSANTLSEWAVAHREGEPSLERARQIFDKRVVSILSRMLAPHPDERPPLQELLDALQTNIPETPMVTSITPHSARLSEVVESLGRSGEHVQLAAANSEDLKVVSTTAARFLEFEGRRVLRLRDLADNGPWSPVVGLLRDLGDEAPFEPDGDQLRVFDELSRRLFDALSGRPATLIFERIHEASPDLVAWWAFVRQRARARANVDLSLFSTADEANLELEPIHEREWLSWRARTLRAEVRGIAQKRWKELVENHGAWLSTMTDALNRELGIERIDEPTPSRALNTAGLEAVGARFGTELDELMRQCAFGEAARRCQVLFEAIEDKKKLPASAPSHVEVLERWVEAATRGTRGVFQVQFLIDALARNLDRDPRVAIAKAKLHQSLGDHGATLEVLRAEHARFRDSTDDTGRLTFGRIQALRGQSLLSTGAYEEAESTAKLGLEKLPNSDHPISTHLRLLEHAPAALRGEPAALEALLELANEARDAPAILLARAHSYRAVGLARRDELDESTDAYIRALEVVESAGLAGELPTFLLNAGTAYHKQGKLGLAREYYARGTRSAQSTTRASTRALLLANQANIDHALGRHDEARALLERGLELARENQLSAIAANCRSLMGDVELAEGNYEDALTIYRELLEDESLTDYQTTEAHLAAAESLLQLDRWQEAQRDLDEARRLIEEAGLSDLEHHQAMMRARLQWAQGGNLEKMAGVELFRRSLMGAQSSGNQKLVLRQSPYLVAQLEREGLDDLLDEVSEIVQNSRNAIAMGLTRELRRDFFSNLPTLGTPTAAKKPASTRSREQVQHAAADSATVDRFYRMLSLNEMILRSENLDELLPTALEIAMTLSNAERGFLLLRDSDRSRVGDFVVAASRDVDGASIPTPHLKVSLTIAEEAARTGRTVVTINARDDERFNTALSVVDLDLSSVLCVPVRDASGLLGAIYLDHRFRPGVFGGEVPRMMEAFGHQVALAITNARRIDELEAERRRLAEANAEVESLLEERELMMRGLEDRVGELTDEVERQRAERSSLHDEFSNIAFTSHVMERLLDQVQRIARGDIPVVVAGESGVGKELIARAIHDSSPRRGGPFVAFNCGAVSESLFESELFGHIKGSFTGATSDRKGLFLSASGGTIFLDEVGEMPLSMQVKLLRVLQEKQVRRVGSTRAEPVDVRVVAATHRDLMTMVDEKEFREDLYYRLAAVTLDVPALRERREDIPIIAQTLLSSVSGDALKLTPPAVRLLTQAEWRGNVRELENVLRAASVLGGDGGTIGEEDLAPLIQIREVDGTGRITSSPRSNRQGRRPKATRSDVVEALRRFDDDREQAAEYLGVSERTLYRYLRKWNLY